MKTTALLVFSGLALASFASAEDSEYNPNSKELSPAPILVQRVKGDVKAVTSTNSKPFALQPNAKLKQGTTITSGPRSEATLIFSNGSALAIGPETKVRINEYLQAGGMDLDIEPYGEGSAKPGQSPPLASLGKEPSISKTRIHVFRGVVYARTKRLHKESTYFMSTPLGRTKVLGTAWRQSNAVNPQNRTMRTEVGVGEGTVEFDPLDTNGMTNDPQRVPSGQEIQVTGTFTSLADMERIGNIESIDNLDINISLSINVDSRAIQDPNFSNALDENVPQQPQQDAAVTGLPPATGGDGGGFFGGGILPGTAGVGAGGGGGGGGGGEGGQPEPPPTPGPTPTPTPPQPPS